MKKITICIFLFSLAVLCQAQWLLNEGFEDANLPAGWTVHDTDGDGRAWHPLNNSSHAHSGNYAAFCEDYLPNVNSDWLITPPLNITSGDSLYFYTRSWISTENLTVKVSTTGTANSNFTSQLAALTNIGTSYSYQQLSLGNFVGQTIYIAFFWQCTNYGILIDDVKVGHPPIVPPVLDLPASFTFVQDTTLSVDFTPYITCTNINTASLSVSGNQHVNVQINLRQVTFTCPDWHGSETLTFTLTDNSSGQQTADQVVVNVNPVPATDLALTQIIIPRPLEYSSHYIYPEILVTNVGNTIYSPPIDVNCVIRDSLNLIVFSMDSVYNQGLAPAAIADIHFSNSWLPATTGHYTVIFTLVSADDNTLNNTLQQSFTVVIREMTGGPDGFGYRWIDSNAEGGPEYVWNDISSTGQSAVTFGVPSFAGDDNFSAPISFGFDFPFYGNTYNHAYIDINGEMLLAENSWYIAYPSSNWSSDGNMFNYLYPIPGYTQMPALVAVYWDDLIADEGTGNIYFQTTGTAPNRNFIVQWDNLHFYAGSGITSLLKFQAVLHENGEIYFYYHTTATGQTGSNVPHNNGRSATVGIQNEATNLGLCYLRELVQGSNYLGVTPPGNLLHDELAIRFYAGTDLQPPVITHSAIGNTFSTSPSISVHIIDLSQITTAELLYNYNGSWIAMPPTQVQNSDYVFNLPDLPQGSLVRYYFHAADEHNNAAFLPSNAPTEYYSFKVLPSADTHVLVVYSGTQDYNLVELPVYEAALQQLNIAYDIYNWQEYVSYRFPIAYDAVLCYASIGISGAQSDTLCIALMQYLDSGTIQNPKNVFFSSDGFAFSQSGHPNSSPEKKLLEAYFRTNDASPTGGGGSNGLGGPDAIGYANGTLLITDNSPIGTPGNLFSVYADSPDCIFRYDSCPDWYADQVQYPEIGAENALLFEGGPFSGHAYLYHGVCATSLELPIYKTFYFSFDFSQLNIATERYLFLHDLMDWFGISGNSAQNDNLPIPQVRLQAIYPNPFSGQTTISFTVKENSDTHLEIYNVKGQLVRTLYNGKIQAGSHQLKWDGKDFNHNFVPSGIYFCRLSNAGVTQTKKLLYLR